MTNKDAHILKNHLNAKAGFEKYEVVQKNLTCFEVREIEIENIKVAEVIEAKKEAEKTKKQKSKEDVI